MEENYVSQQGYDKLNATIEELRAQIEENKDTRKNAILRSALEILEAELKRLEVVEKPENDYVYLNDTVVLDMIYGPDEHEEDIVKLVAICESVTGDVKEITIDSPLGKAIHKKAIGDQVSYTVNGHTFFATIKSKLNLEEEQTMRR